MAESRDGLARLIACLFAKDIRAHPMPFRRQQQLLLTVRRMLTVYQGGETVCGEKQNDTACDTGAAWRSGGDE